CNQPCTNIYKTELETKGVHQQDNVVTGLNAPGRVSHGKQALGDKPDKERFRILHDDHKNEAQGLQSVNPVVDTINKGCGQAEGVLSRNVVGYHEAKNTAARVVADAKTQAWDHLGILPEELKEVSGEREVWMSPLSLIPLRPGPDKWKMTSMSTFFLKSDRRNPNAQMSDISFLETACGDRGKNYILCVF
ncbi:hypothetical protein ILYODFUR_017991, partial [Ilyodon furcidens]